MTPESWYSARKWFRTYNISRENYPRVLIFHEKIIAELKYSTRKWFHSYDCFTRKRESLSRENVLKCRGCTFRFYLGRGGGRGGVTYLIANLTPGVVFGRQCFTRYTGPLCRLLSPSLLHGAWKNDVGFHVERQIITTFATFTPGVAVVVVAVVVDDAGCGSVSWLLNVSAACKCISGTDLRRQ